jgi:hypothetical protein
MVSYRLDFQKTWNGGGDSSVIAIAADGSETLIEKHYTGFEEYSHGFNVVHYLKARHRFEEGKGDFIEILKYELRSGNPDFEWTNEKASSTYLSKDSGKTWEVYI